ncbi:glycosyltransferase [Patescibacteria group bacterium]|nr:glycosyltransferase [Patescibacteria group bacterium]
MKIGVMIPSYLEGENLGELTKRLIKALEDITKNFNILYVIQGDDGSKEMIESLNDERVNFLYFSNPLGVAKAFITGFSAILNDVDYIITMDADLNHQPEEIKNLWKCLEEKNADITIGSRYIKGGVVIGMPIWKAFLSRFMNKIINIFSNIKVADKTSGFRIYKPSALKYIIENIKADNFEFYPEVIMLANNHGFTFAETPITFKFRVKGKSKMYKMQTIIGYLKIFMKKII